MENKIPNTWEYLSLGELIVYRKGRKPKVSNKQKFHNSIPYLDIKAIETGEVTNWVDENSSSICNEDELLMVWDGARSGWIGKAQHGAIGSTIMSLKPIIINTDYLYHYLKMNYNYLNSNTKGTGIPHVNSEILLNLRIPFAPLQEQDRIAKKLNKVLKNHEVLSQRLKKVKSSINYLKQAILDNAFQEKVTNNDSKEIDTKKWVQKMSSEIFTYVTSGSRGWAKYYNKKGKQLFIRITNMNNLTYELDLNPNKLQFIELPKNIEGKRTLLRERDILISITADIGKISLIPHKFPYEAYINQHICLARPIKSINEKYVAYFLMSIKGVGQFDERKKGAIKAGLTLGDIKNLKIDVPSLAEQNNIVQYIETLFTKCFKIEEYCQILEKKIGQLPQFIFNKAFRGELLPQDINDTPVELTINRITEERKSILQYESFIRKKRNVDIQKINSKNMSKNLVEIIQDNGGKMSAKKLWQESDFKDNIDNFYEELKKQVEELKTIIESKEKGYLEVA